MLSPAQPALAVAAVMMTSKLRAQIEKAWRHSFRQTKRTFTPSPYRSYRSKQIAEVERRADVEIAHNEHLYRLLAQIVELTKLHARQEGRVKRELPKSSSAAETKCLKWLVEKMEKSPQLRPGSKEIIQKEAQRLFNGLSARGFARVWGNACAAVPKANWIAPGRPPKKIQ
jgi:hypothetical protein